MCALLETTIEPTEHDNVAVDAEGHIPFKDVKISSSA